MILFFLLLGVGTAAYIYYDKLDPFESFYFSFINFTTIGFGDIIPQHKSFTAFIISGSAVTYNMSVLTICFSILQSMFKGDEEEKYCRMEMEYLFMCLPSLLHSTTFPEAPLFFLVCSLCKEW